MKCIMYTKNLSLIKLLKINTIPTIIEWRDRHPIVIDMTMSA